LEPDWSEKVNTPTAHSATILPVVHVFRLRASRAGDFHSAGWLNLYDCLFDGNTSIRRGSAVFAGLYNDDLQVVNSTFSRSTSVLQPTGGVMIEGGSSAITNSILRDNRGQSALRVTSEGPARPA
jgi:hypothetical protein